MGAHLDSRVTSCHYRDIVIGTSYDSDDGRGMKGHRLALSYVYKSRSVPFHRVFDVRLDGHVNADNIQFHIYLAQR